MNRILVRVFFPQIYKEYDVWIPLNKSIYNIIVLLSTGVNSLNNGIYQPMEIPILYNKLTGNYYDLNMKVRDTDIENGTELILI